jgi:urea transporter
MKQLRNLFPGFIPSILNSYSQVFFSDNRIFAVILLVVTFFDLYAGISGLISLLVSNAAAFLIGFNRQHIRSGFYGFNSLLVGLGLGIFYQPGMEFFVLLVFTSLLTLMLTVMLEGVIGKYYLPYLSIPFLLGIWMVLLASRQFESLAISQRGIYMLNEMYGLGGINMVRVYEWFVNLELPQSLVIYFRSLGAIFFQYHLFTGLLIAIGLLIYSRIAFLLSLTGYYLAYLFYQVIGADIQALSYSYIGFNFILTSIAAGGFFIVPSKYSFLWVALLTPLSVIVITSTGTLFSLFQLSVYSLPFNVVVLLFLYVLKFRERFYRSPQVVIEQGFSPEKNLYIHNNYSQRFDLSHPIGLSLPFWGEWRVTQGHEGEYTHQSDWRHAWDFEIMDEEGRFFTGTGKDTKDYFAFGKPVIAPADGFVEQVLDGIEDNLPGQVNLVNNWGNTIVLRHQDHLYSKLCHLKKGSILVKPGDQVKSGTKLALCGNSGRSPVPHIHFQVQKDPYIGAPTLEYPLANYVITGEPHIRLVDRGIPDKDQRIAAIEKNVVLEKAYQFIPGQVLTFDVHVPGERIQTESWYVQADLYNNLFLKCGKTGARAYFSYEGPVFRFTNYQGPYHTLLYYFVLGNFKVVKGFHQQMMLTDQLPLNLFHHKWLIFLQDFVAPFYLFIRPVFRMTYSAPQNDLSGHEVMLHSTCQVNARGRIIREMSCDTLLSGTRIASFSVVDGNRILSAKCSVE